MLTKDGPSRAASIEAEVRYHLLTEARRARIGYRNRTPIDYPIFAQRLELMP
jgi:hypothetical protein